MLPKNLVAVVTVAIGSIAAPVANHHVAAAVRQYQIERVAELGSVLDTSDDGRYVVVIPGLVGGTPEVLDRQTNRTLPVASGFVPVAISGDGATLFGRNGNDAVLSKSPLGTSIATPISLGQYDPAAILSVDSDFTGQHLAVGIASGNWLGQALVVDTTTGTVTNPVLDASPPLGTQGADPTISADGRFVAFVAQDAAACDASICGQVWVLDRSNGDLTQVSKAADGATGDYASKLPAISGNGRVVAFFSDATNLVQGTSSKAQRLYVRDVLSSVTTLVSDAQPVAGLGTLRISAAGNRIAFVADGQSESGRSAQPFTWTDGVVAQLSIDADGTAPNGAVPGFGSAVLAMSADGATVVFDSFATDLGGGGSGIFVATLPSAQPGHALPARLADTRAGFTTVDGLNAGTGLRPAGSMLEVQIAGRGSIPSNARAAVLNVTAVSEGDGYITVFPCGAAPTASNLNVRTGDSISNTVFTGLSATGTVCVFNQSPTHLVIDGESILSGFQPLTAPARLLDTRPGGATIDGKASGGGLADVGMTIELPVTGRGGVPADASIVVLNLTVTGAESNGYLTVWPCTQPRPGTSNLNYTAGVTVPNAVVTGLSTTGSVCIFSSGRTHVLADVQGSFSPDAFEALQTSTRLYDSRPGFPTIDGPSSESLRIAGSSTRIEVSGRGGIAADARTAILNVTVVDPTLAGYVTVYPCGATPPTASNVNFAAGQTLPNLVVATLTEDGSICVFTNVETHVVVDAFGELRIE